MDIQSSDRIKQNREASDTWTRIASLSERALAMLAVSAPIPETTFLSIHAHSHLDHVSCGSSGIRSSGDASPGHGDSRNDRTDGLNYANTHTTVLEVDARKPHSRWREEQSMIRFDLSRTIEVRLISNNLSKTFASSHGSGQTYRGCSQGNLQRERKRDKKRERERERKRSRNRETERKREKQHKVKDKEQRKGEGDTNLSLDFSPWDVMMWAKTHQPNSHVVLPVQLQSRTTSLSHNSTDPFTSHLSWQLKTHNSTYTFTSP